MTATYKAFAHLFITASGDHKFSRVFSGRYICTDFSLLSLDGFNSDTQTMIQAVATVLFIGLTSSRLFSTT